MPIYFVLFWGEQKHDEDIFAIFEESSWAEIDAEI